MSDRAISALPNIPSVGVAGDLIPMVRGGVTYQSSLSNAINTIAQAQASVVVGNLMGQANGVATLDGSTKIPLSQLPDSILGQVEYQELWDASTNTPTIPAASSSNKGHYYIVNVAGSTDLDGITDWKVGDWAISNGTSWGKVDNTDQVTSVNGQIGAVNLTTSNITEGSNLYFTEARVRGAVLTGFSATNSTISATDSVLDALGKAQGQINNRIQNAGGVVSLEAGLLSALPPASVIGRFYYATDDRRMRYDNGTSWDVFSTLVSAGDASSGFGGNRIPYFDGSSIWTSNANFVFNGTGLGVGISTVTSTALHVRGAASAGVTKTAYFTNAANSDIASFYDNRTIVFGGGSAYSNSDFTLRAFGSSGGANYGFVASDSSDDTMIRLVNAPGTTSAGVQIVRTGGLTGRYALRIIGSSTTSMTIKSSGAMGFGYEAALTEIRGDMPSMRIGLSSDATFKGLVFDTFNNTYGFNFITEVGRTGGARYFFNIGGVRGTLGVISDQTESLIKVNPTVVHTTANGSLTNFIGYDYEPSLTLTSGSKHYAMLLRSGMVGIGLGAGAVYPTSQLQVKATNGYEQFRLETQYTPTGTADTNGEIGDMCFDDDYIYYKGTGGWTRGALSTF